MEVDLLLTIKVQRLFLAMKQKSIGVSKLRTLLKNLSKNGVFEFLRPFFDLLLPFFKEKSLHGLLKSRSLITSIMTLSFAITFSALAPLKATEKRDFDQAVSFLNKNSRIRGKTYHIAQIDSSTNISVPVDDVSSGIEGVDSSSSEEAVPYSDTRDDLLEITEDQVYIYETPSSEKDRSAAIKFGTFQSDSLENPDTGQDFGNLYESSSSPVILFDYEFDWIMGTFGQLKYKLGSGMYFTQGNGQFESEEYSELTPRENFSFIALPNNAGLVYYMRFWDSQPVVPYFEGGGDVITFAELRGGEEDSGFFGLGTSKFGGALAVHGSGGLAVDLMAFDPESLIRLDREYGINRIFFTAEFRYMVGLTSYNFTSSILNGGFLAEF